LLSNRTLKLISTGIISLAVLGGIFWWHRQATRPVYPTTPVTIPEGYTLAQIDRLLGQKGVIDPGELFNFDTSGLEKEYCFLKKGEALEGYLFPDTYEFFLGSSPRVVAERLLDNFNRKAGRLLCGRPDLKKQVVMASLIEKEVPDQGEDRNLVSGILWKRIGAGVPLQVDASLCYAVSPLGCRREDIDSKIDSPYNTYLHYGLPPGPIANPGLSAIIAALEPQESAYWYYLSAAGTGQTIFSKDLDEHNRNIVKYLVK
jgi:UPF0755 protein